MVRRIDGGLADGLVIAGDLRLLAQAALVTATGGAARPLVAVAAAEGDQHHGKGERAGRQRTLLVAPQARAWVRPGIVNKWVANG